MVPHERPLTLYGATSEHGPLPWAWVEEQLVSAGTYWVMAHASHGPHPRPVWGVWSGQTLYLSIGSPVLSRLMGEGERVSVHLESGTDVVILERAAAPRAPRTTPGPVVELYNAKYDWDYRVDEYGELTRVEPATVMAWRSAGWAGRDGFQATGCWDFDRLR